MARLYRCVLIWTAPALFMVVAPLYLVIHGENYAGVGEQAGASSALMMPFLILSSFAAISSVADRCLVCSPLFPVVICMSQLMVLLLLVNAPMQPGDVDAEPNPHAESSVRIPPKAALKKAPPVQDIAASAKPADTLHHKFLEQQHGDGIAQPSGSAESVTTQPAKSAEIVTQPAKTTTRIGDGKISVVLPCASEGEYTRKTVLSFCERTPADVLQEIIVVDDGSDPPLEGELKGVEARCRMRLLRHKDTMGLMIAKQTGGDAALGEFIGFFDCHVAPNRGWHAEIIRLLKLSPRRLVVPTITDLDIDTWDERPHAQTYAKCYIDWNADFMWFEDSSDYIPIISGGLVATSREWWNMSGGFDKKMRGWGGENIDQSLRAWLCGGDILRAKSSRIAHMWRVGGDMRTRVRYKRITSADNTGRVAAAWFDDFLPKFQRGRLLHSKIDVSNILERKKALGCKPFAYFIHRFRRVYRTGGVLPIEAFKLKSKNGCVTRQGNHYGIDNCEKASIFHFGNMNKGKKGMCCSGIREWNTLECFDRLDPNGPLPYFCDVTGGNLNQQWVMLPDGRLQHNLDRRCLSASGYNLFPSDCEEATRWKQVENFLPPETQMYEDAVKKYGFTDDMPDN